MQSWFVIFREEGSAGSRVSAKDFPELKTLMEIAGPWEVSFDPKWGGPTNVMFDKLEDWSERPEAGIKYYSGTATYRKVLNLQSPIVTRRMYLDLGNVEAMARVSVNGKECGVAWKPPYRVDITVAARAGDNSVEIEVVNLWINRMIGDELLPEDSDRHDNGTLKAWPQWVKDGKPSPTGRYTFTTWRLWKKGNGLVESGLLGPVMLRTSINVELK